MRAISDAIREGAEAFLSRQYRTIGAIAVVLAVVVFVGYHLSPRTAPFATEDGGEFSGGCGVLGAGWVIRACMCRSGRISARRRRRGPA